MYLPISHPQSILLSEKVKHFQFWISILLASKFIWNFGSRNVL